MSGFSTRRLSGGRDRVALSRAADRVVPATGHPAILRFRETGEVSLFYRSPAKGFRKIFQSGDIALLAGMDERHGNLVRPCDQEAFGEGLPGLWGHPVRTVSRTSVSHLYNLRGGKEYLSKRRHWTKSRSNKAPVGERRPPRPEGSPGYLRIDSVHQGDQEGQKGGYHINAVDAVTQYQVVASCERISEAYLIPVHEAILASFPFPILGIHADNGSGYINYSVARLLEKLRIELPGRGPGTATTTPRRSQRTRRWSGNTWDMLISPSALPKTSTSFAKDT